MMQPTSEVAAMQGIPLPSYNEFGVPLAFLRNCGTWEGTAQRVDRTGKLIDEHLVRVKIAILITTS